MSELTKTPDNVGINTIIPIGISDQQVNCRLINSPNVENNPLSIEIENPTDEGEVKKAIVDGLQGAYWFLSSEYANQPLRQRFDVELAEGVNVGVYNFWKKDLLPEEVASIGKSLMRYYHSLKDKKPWTLKSIQIESHDVKNPVSGEPYRGEAVRVQKRFKLFPVLLQRDATEDRSIVVGWKGLYFTSQATLP
ncbi:MAG: hypothetical protein HY425_03175 [Candidatus Levybacteria bacterium]|nr:hypothetical protein [Candidatus Levybacteria bacterium]